MQWIWLLILDMFFMIFVFGILFYLRSRKRRIEIKVSKFKQHKLIESDEQYRCLFECAFDVIYSFDRNFKVMSVSPSVERVLGYKPVDIVGKFFPELGILAPEYFDIAFSHIAKLFAGESIEPSVYEFIAKDGTRKIAELSGAPIKKDGETVGVISVARDITDKKKFEKKLQMEREQALSIFNNIIQPITIIDMNTYEILFANDTLMRLYDLNPIGGICYKQLHGLDAPCTFCRLDALKKQNNIPIKMEFHNSTLNRDYIVIAQIINWNDFRKAKFEIAIDITYQKRYEKKLEKANEELTIGIKERSVLQNKIIKSERTVTAGLLAASIAHDIKSPLMAVSAHLELIKEGLKSNKSLLGHIGFIEKGCNDIEHTVKRLSNLSCSAPEKNQLVNFNTIIEDINDLMHGFVMQKGISIHLNLSPDVPDIKASVHHLRHVVMNLISNAVEAIVERSIEEDDSISGTTKHDAISISTFFRSGKIIAEVTDTGHGISENDLAHIFDPFYTNKKQTGTGLGLYICQNILKEYNGSISASNLPEKGAIFTIELSAN